MVAAPVPTSLAELEALLARDLLLLNEPAKDWVPPHVDLEFGPVLDVLIVGGGMAGLAAGFRLKRLGLRRLAIVDRSRPGSEGPWTTYARMETLRSPKELAGPALGLPNLTFRAWYEAQHGAEAFARIYRISRLDWAAYLGWYGKVAAIPTESGTELVALAGHADGVVATLRSENGERRVIARHLVLATGRDGLGGPYIPPLYRDLPATQRAHSADDIDFSALAGRDVGVIGAGASAVDNAGEALEAGARSVTLLVRRPDLPRINKGLGIGSPGLNYGFYDLPAEKRWAIDRYLADSATPPPHNSMLRVGRHRNFRVLTGCAVEAVRTDGTRVHLATTRGDLAFDVLILGTGFSGDWAQRPELAALAGRVRLVRDAPMPPGHENAPLAEEPVLGPSFEFLERQPGSLPWAFRVHCFNFAATLSHGKVTGDIPAISTGADRLAEGICSALFAEDYDEQFRRLVAFDTPELLGDEWVQEPTEEAAE